MIYGLARDVATALAVREYPVAVFYQRDRVSASVAARAPLGTIVFDRDRQGGDATRGPLGTHGNPASPLTRWLGVVATVTVRVPTDGARGAEHEHECDAVVDALQVALAEWALEGRAPAIEWVESRYLRPDEEGAAPAGVTYRVRFRLCRGVAKRDYDGAVQPVGTVGTVSLGANVTLNGTDIEPVPPGAEPEPEGD
jgi:hypothetical protein